MRSEDNNAGVARKPPSRLSSILWAVLLLWLLASVAGFALYRHDLALRWQGPKLATPVVVIESDDWGIGNVHAAAIAPDQTPDARQTLGAQRINELLRRHRDGHGRHPIFSAFVVTGQADVAAILADREHRYHWQPIDKTMPRLVAALRQAADERLWDLQYHCRDHRNARRWSAALVEAAEKARAAGRELTPIEVEGLVPRPTPARDAMTAEYYEGDQNALRPLPRETINEKVTSGIGVFERAFGRRPTSTVAPRHLWGPRAAAAWTARGIRFVHAINRQRGPAVAGVDRRARKLGYRAAAGLVGVPRNVDLDVYDGAIPPLEALFAEARTAAWTGQPIVIQTHMANCTERGEEGRKAMLARLDALLARLEREYPDLVYLSARQAGELGESGEVTIRLPDGASMTISGATGPQRVLLWGRTVWVGHDKVCAWGWGSLILLGTVALGFVWIGISRLRRRRLISTQ